MIHREQRDAVTILRLDHGKVSAMDTELCDILTEEFAGLEEAEAVVLTGTGSVFSAGVDLFKVVEGGAEYLDEFLPALTRCFHAMFAFQRPLVGALNGHAIAGGCVMTQACDHRLMAAGKIGVPELLVSVPYPTIAIEIMRFAVRPHLQELTYFGATVEPAEALAKGLIDEVVAPEKLLDRACEVAARFGTLSREAFAIAKRQMRGPYLDRFEAESPITDPEVYAIWKSDEARERIRGYLERTLKK